MSSAIDKGRGINSYKVHGYSDSDNINENRNENEHEHVNEHENEHENEDERRRVNDRKENETNDGNRCNYDNVSNNDNTFDNVFYSKNMGSNNDRNNVDRNIEEIIKNDSSNINMTANVKVGININIDNDIGCYSSNFDIDINTPVPNAEPRRFSCTDILKDEQIKNIIENDVNKIEKDILTDFMKICDIINFIEYIKNNHLSDKTFNLFYNDKNSESFGFKGNSHFTPTGVPFGVHSEKFDDNYEFSEIFCRKSITATSLFLILRSILSPLLILENQYFNSKSKKTKIIPEMHVEDNKLKEEDKKDKIKLEGIKK